MVFRIFFIQLKEHAHPLRCVAARRLRDPKRVPSLSLYHKKLFCQRFVTIFAKTKEKPPARHLLVFHGSRRLAWLEAVSQKRQASWAIRASLQKPDMPVACPAVKRHGRYHIRQESNIDTSVIQRHRYYSTFEEKCQAHEENPPKQEKRPIRRCVSSLCFTFAIERRKSFRRKKLKHCKWTI